MGKFIRYKRFQKHFNSEESIQEFFDKLVNDGWEIISYREYDSNCYSNIPNIIDFPPIYVVCVCGKNRKELK